MRIPSGTTDQFIYFVGVDSTDFTTRETGLTGFTVYRSRNGAAAVAMTTPTINETDSTNMPGVYELLLDEDMTIGTGNDTEEMVFHITATGMAPVTRTIELYRPKITVGETATVSSGEITANGVSTLQTDLATVDSNVDAILVDTGTTLPASISTIDTNVDAILVDTNELQTDWANGGRLDNILDARAAESSISALNDISTADVNAQVVDVIRTDTIAEMSQGAPPLAPTLAQMVNYLYRQMVRNEIRVDTNTANQQQIIADDGTTILYEKGLTNASNVTTIGEAQTGA